MTKTEEDFYVLTESTLNMLENAKLTTTERRIYDRLCLLDPFGDRYIKVSTLEMIGKCNCSKSTYYRAIAKFGEFGLFDFQDNGFQARNLRGSKSSVKTETVSTNTSVKTGNLSVKTGNLSVKTGNLSVKTGTIFPEMRLENPKTLTQNKTDFPQTYSDLIQTNSEDQIDQKTRIFEILPEVENEYKHSLEELYKKAIAEISKNEEAAEGIRNEIAYATIAPAIKDLFSDSSFTVSPNSSPPEPDQELFDFIVREARKRGATLKNPRAYVRKCLASDKNKWRSLLAQSKAQPREYFDEWRVENAIALAINAGDLNFARSKIAWLRSQNQDEFADRLIAKFGELTHDRY